MKKIISVLALTFCIYNNNTSAQITYETTYTHDTTNPQFTFLVRHIKLNQNITKYLTATFNTSGSKDYNIVYKLYNLNHSIYKTLPLITDTVNNFANPYSIQENLFNTDATIEIAYFKYNNNVNSFKVINEYGAFVFERDTVYPSASTFNTENGTKLILTLGFGYEGTKEIYSLGGIVLTTIKPDGEINNEEMIELSPNPSKEYTRIIYNLPPNVNSAEIVVFNLNGSEIKRFMVDRTFTDLVVSNDDLPSGNYFYSLVVNNQLTGTKKSIVIK